LSVTPRWGRRRRLAEALALYRGDFLAGFSFRVPAFEEWLRTLPCPPQRVGGAHPRKRRLSPRDAFHFAIMEREGVHRIMSFDRGFDGVRGIERLS
jgi:predicted nucleic acid-binding protein